MGQDFPYALGHTNPLSSSMYKYTYEDIYVCLPALHYHLLGAQMSGLPQSSTELSGKRELLD